MTIGQLASLIARTANGFASEHRGHAQSLYLVVTPDGTEIVYTKPMAANVGAYFDSISEPLIEAYLQHGWLPLAASRGLGGHREHATGGGYVTNVDRAISVAVHTFACGTAAIVLGVAVPLIEEVAA